MRALLRTFLLTVAAAVFAAAQTPLLDLVPGNAAGIAGVNVQRTAASSLGRLLLQRIAGRDEMLRRITKVSGTALWEKLDEVMLISGPAAGTDGGETVVLARPFPDAAAMAKWLPGVKRATYNGFDLFLLNRGGSESAFALAPGGVAVAGDPELVRAVLDRAAAPVPGSRPALLDRAGEVRLKFDVWAVADGRFRTPERAARRTRVPRMSGRIQQAGGGFVFGQNVQFSGEMVTRTEDEARTLAELFRFAGSLAERNSGGGPAPKDLDVSAADTSVRIAFALTAQDFRRLLEADDNER